MILFVHGFGVLKDSRGMYVDILRSVNEDCHLLEFNSFNTESNELRVAPLDRQIAHLEETDARFKNTPYTLIAHSQGCMVAAKAQLKNVKHTILLAPASGSSSSGMKAFFAERPDTTFAEDGTARLARKDGTTTIVNALYWQSLDNYGDVKTAYQNYAKNHPSHIVLAGDDTTVRNEVASSVQGVPIDTIPNANHNFDEPHRQALIAHIKRLLRTAN